MKRAMSEKNKRQEKKKIMRRMKSEIKEKRKR